MQRQPINSSKSSQLLQKEKSGFVFRFKLSLGTSAFSQWNWHIYIYYPNQGGKSAMYVRKSIKRNLQNNEKKDWKKNQILTGYFDENQESVHPFRYHGVTAFLLPNCPTKSSSHAIFANTEFFFSFSLFFPCLYIEMIEGRWREGTGYWKSQYISYEHLDDINNYKRSWQGPRV